MKKEVNTPHQIIDIIKNQTKPKIWSKDLRDWYVAEIIDLVGYNLKIQRQDLLKKIDKALNGK